MSIRMSAPTPSTLLVEHDTYQEFVATRDFANTVYLGYLLRMLVGGIMPIEIKITSPLKPDEVHPDTLDLLKWQGYDINAGSQSRLNITGVLTHPELNGHPLDREMLPMLMAQGPAKDIARQIAEEPHTERPNEITLNIG